MPTPKPRRPPPLFDWDAQTDLPDNVDQSIGLLTFTPETANTAAARLLAHALRFPSRENESLRVVATTKETDYEQQTAYQFIGAQLINMVQLLTEALPGEAFNLEIVADENGDWVLTLTYPETLQGEDGASVEMRVSGGFIQWRQDDNDPTWTNLIALSALQGPQGEQGEPGEQGAPGAGGVHGEVPASITPDTETAQQAECNLAYGLGEYLQKQFHNALTLLEQWATAGKIVSERAADIADSVPIMGGPIAAVINACSVSAELAEELMEWSNTADWLEWIQCELFCDLRGTGPSFTEEELSNALGEMTVAAAALPPQGPLLIEIGPAFALFLLALNTTEVFRRAAFYANEEQFCEECSCWDDSWCEDFDLTASDGGWAVWSSRGVSGSRDSSGWHTALTGNGAGQVSIIRTFDESTITDVVVSFTIDTGDAGSTGATTHDVNIIDSWPPEYQTPVNKNAGNYSIEWHDAEGQDCSMIGLTCWSSYQYGSSSSSGRITHVQICGRGTNPFE